MYVPPSVTQHRRAGRIPRGPHRSTTGRCWRSSAAATRPSRRARSARDSSLSLAVATRTNRRAANRGERRRPVCHARSRLACRERSYAARTRRIVPQVDELENCATVERTVHAPLPPGEPAVGWRVVGCCGRRAQRRSRALAEFVRACRSGRRRAPRDTVSTPRRVSEWRRSAVLRAARSLRPSP